MQGMYGLGQQILNSGLIGNYGLENYGMNMPTYGMNMQTYGMNMPSYGYGLENNLNFNQSFPLNTGIIGQTGLLPQYGYPTPVGSKYF